jgi:transcriptional antiterminator RfaH
MPLLPREPDLAPEDFFSLPEERFPWGVAHVRSRQEKRLARLLGDRGVPFFLPQFASKRQRAGRSFTSYLPLFPGYLFFRGGRGERDHVVRSNLVANVIEVLDAPTLAAELSQIRALQLAGASLRPCEVFVPGERVRIRKGAFSGYSGVVVREKGDDRLVILVTLINKAVSVEFERGVVAKAKV